MLLNDLQALPNDIVLILDDYHLIEAAEIHDGMAFLLAHLPSQLHLVLATRSDPALSMARLRGRGELVEVRAADLRFTAEESAAYLNGSMGLALTEDDVAALDGRTEGWIAALQLAALSMQGRDDASAFIAGFAGDDRYIVDYLAEEVLARQPAEVRDFLLKTSMLDRLTGPLCDAVTGREGGRATLVSLERANLFLVPLDDRREWYRYHHLFADVLQAHLLEELADEVPELHRRASAWYEQNGALSEAIEHALESGDLPRAAHLMELTIPAVRRDRREAEFARWVGMLPDEVVKARPVLGVFFVGALAQVSEFETIASRLSDIESSLGVSTAGGTLAGRATAGRGGRRHGGVQAPSRDRGALPGCSGAGARRPRRHRRPRPAGDVAVPARRPPHPRSSSRSCPGSPRGPLETSPRPMTGTPSASQGSSRSGSSPTYSGAASRWPTSGEPRAGSGRRCRRTSGPSSSLPSSPAHRHCGAPPTCTSAWPSSCWTATSWRPLPSAWPSSHTARRAQRAAEEPLPLARRDGTAPRGRR